MAHHLERSGGPSFSEGIAAAVEIRRALEELLGHDIHHFTVWRLLERNAWRKVVPRPLHVESKHRVQEDFRKTSWTS